MKTKIIGALLVIGQMASAQNKQSVADFKKAEIRISTTVYLKKSDVPYVSFESKDSAGTGIRVATGDGILIIEEKKGMDIPEKVTVGYVSLDELTLSGAATVKTSEPIAADKLSLQVSGASKAKLELAVNELSISVSGAGSCNLNGRAGTMTAIVSGASSLKAEELMTDKVQINASGASTARVNVSTSLTGIVSGASSLKFAGEPKEVQINQSGASNVKRIDANGNTGSISGDVTTTTTREGKDSTRKYTINGRYEIIVHENFHVDTNTYRYKRKHDGRIRKQNWVGVDLFQNGFLTPDNDVSLPLTDDYMSLNYGLRNLGWNLNMFEKDFRFAKGHMQIVTGLGFSFNYYNLKSDINLNADSSYTWYTTTPGATYQKNKLRESFVTVPLLLEFNSSRRDSRNFHIAAGVIGGIKMGSSTKQIVTIDGRDYKSVRKDDYNLFPFKLDATVRVGYGQFTLFATYSLTPLFEYNKGPELYPFTVGVRIVPFD